ncbi:unnamed protein product [Dracunculus medinensis]|uniref:Oxidoreductase-like domain-containing protein n=1 Tax=Dracunculus medinensis TaxID=318479 RepID=A0A0N4UMZ8_DRAME|nr:unnamed protein product [Dracunculus medinensis]
MPEKASCTFIKTVVPGERRCISSPPEPPGPLSCCGSGCANCVWIEYGTKLVSYYSHRHIDHILNEIESQISNPVICEFIKSEIRSKATS